MRHFLVSFFSFLLIFFSQHLFADISLPKEGYVETEGAKIYYKRVGQGDPVIIVHGGPGDNSSYFLPQFEALAKNCELIFYDQRGSGKSYENLDFNKITLPQFIEDLDNLRKALNLNHFSLIGHSWGALITSLYAKEHPENVVKMVLMNPIPASSQDLMAFASELQHRIKESHNTSIEISESAEFLAGDLPTIKKFYGEFFKEFFFEPKNVGKLNFSIDSQDALQGVIVYRIFEETLLKGGYDYKPKLNGLKTPTLILHGDCDPIPLWTVKEFEKLIPNVKCRVIKDCGHFPHIEKPDEFFDEVNLFLRKN